LSKLKVNAISKIFIEGMRSWQLTEVKIALQKAGLSERQLNHLNLDALHKRLKFVNQHFETELAKSNKSEDEFFSSGVWHKVQ